MVLIDHDFPYTPPRFAVHPPPEPLAWPHIEENGLLCLLPGDASIDTISPVAVFEELLEDASRLCKESVQGCNPEDFRAEFHSYWAIAVNSGKSSTKVLSLLEPRGPSRPISMLETERAVFLAENDHELQRWLQHRFRNSTQPHQKGFRRSLLIWLLVPLIPDQYPRTGIDLLGLANELGPETATQLEEMAAASPPNLRVILGAIWNGVGCFASVECPKPAKERAGRGTRDPISKGFRPGRATRQVKARRYLVPKVGRAIVVRADHMWVHGRDRDKRQARLREKRVACLGCGSLGGAVARLLAQSGVGNLILVDPEHLEWSNIGRHVLGARSVNERKAEQLATEIRSAFPHLNSVESRVERVGPHAGTLMECLESCDLILSMMGNWNAETFLNDWQQVHADAPPILYGWLEPRAAAAHAVLIGSGQGCLRCGFDECGRFKLQATSWPENSIDFREPACGALFTPYGPAELCWAHALVSATALEALLVAEHRSLHHAWVCTPDRLQEAGGRWSERWVAQVGDPETGGKTIILQWLKSAKCPTCLQSKNEPCPSPMRQATKG